MSEKRHYRIFYRRVNGFICAGLEEYEQGARTASVKAFASVYVEGPLNNSEIISMLIDDYCNPDEPIKVKLSQALSITVLQILREKYPNITFRRARSREIPNIKLLCDDAILRKETIFERL